MSLVMRETTLEDSEEEGGNICLRLRMMRKRRLKRICWRVESEENDVQIGGIYEWWICEWQLDSA